MRIMKNFIKFTRFYLSLAVSLSGILTYFTITQTPSFEIFFPWLGILLLALGTSALNQIQEREFDAKMQRTSQRPLVTQIISLPQAYIIALSLITFSIFILYYSMSILGIYFAIFTIFTYNIAYTYMKRVSYWALIVGSFLGVVAPMIGWIVAGASIYDPRFIFIFCLFFMWQVPHFWLLMLMNGDDYKQAGFPTLKDKIGELGLMRVIALWCYLLIIVAGFMQLSFNVPFGIWIAFIIISIYMSYSSFLLLSGQKKGNKFFKIKFMELNTFVLLNIIFLIINNFI